jgi:hypothetical protein
MLIPQNAATGCNLDQVPLISYLNNMYAKSSLNLTSYVRICFQNFYFTGSFSIKQSPNFFICHILATYPAHKLHISQP